MRGLDVKVGLVDREHYLTMREDGSEAKLHDRASSDPHADVSDQLAEKFKTMRDHAAGLYETARWMLYRNKPERYRR
jgi:hypothetical protein